MSLTEFLLTRIAEDEADVREYVESASPTRRWLSTRVLAECEAKRRVVDLHQPVSDSTAFGSLTGEACATCLKFHADMDCENEQWPCATLRILATIYAAHPDYHEAWRAPRTPTKPPPTEVSGGFCAPGETRV